MTPEERLDRLERIVEKQNEGVKDLIRVGRIVTDAQIVTNSQINELQRAIASNGSPERNGRPPERPHRYRGPDYSPQRHAARRGRDDKMSAATTFERIPVPMTGD